MNSKQNGLAVLVLSLVELLRQLMEAQVLRRMEANQLTDMELEQAGASLKAIEEEVYRLCEVLGVEYTDLNWDLGELGRLLPEQGSYYPERPQSQASVLELLDRLISTGIVLDGEIDIGLAELSLINLKLRLLLTSSSEVKLRGGNG